LPSRPCATRRRTAASCASPKFWPRGRPDRGDGDARGSRGRRPHPRAAGIPDDRDLRLQALARGDEGFLLALGYSTQRGYGRNHPFTGEIRIGEVEVEFDVPELGFAVSLGTIQVTECQMVNQFKGSAKAPPQFTRGYGLVFGQSERKAMSMSLVDRALRAASSARTSPRRRRTRNSSSRIPTTCRRPASSSI
jgi:alpha-D-ribose 1-methylphosphonate 5-triphosphate synthase subunit PhnI